MTNLDVTTWRIAPRVRRESAILTSWLLLSLPLLWAAISIFKLPIIWLGMASYLIVTAMCLELLISVLAYARARMRLNQRLRS